MNHIFYLLAIFPMLWEFTVIMSPRKTREQVTRCVKTPPKEKSTTQIAFLLLSFGYIVWCFIGLWSSQWMLFTMLLILGLVYKKNILIRVLDAIISAIIIVFMIINVYHLHIDLFTFILNHGK